MYTTYPGLLTQDEYHECFQILQDKEGWSSRGSSVGNGNCFMYKDLGSYDVFTRRLFDKIVSKTGKSLKLKRVYANGQEVGKDGDWHMDDNQEGTWTFLLYMNSFADGGETEFRSGDVFMRQTAVMNTGLIFDSRIEHRGLAPASGTETRITVAWKLFEVPKFQFFDAPVPFCIIRNYYTSEELRLVWAELDFLEGKFRDPKKTGSAMDVNGIPRKNNKGLFLDEIYTDRLLSNILVVNRKIGHDDIKKNLEGKNWFYKYLTNPSDRLIDKTLVSYYDDGAYYKPHVDAAVITCISYHWKEPKEFTGGDLYFGDFCVPIENNCMLIFPSCTEHEVKLVSGQGRFAITQFLNFS